MSPASRHRAVVSQRLRQFVRRLHDARQASPDDPEIVHRLRVAARRAEAALGLFAPWLPARRTRLASKKIRRIRRRAGRARDLDLLAGTTVPPTPLDRPPTWLIEARLEAYRRVRRSARKTVRRRLESELRAIERRVRWRASGDETDATELLATRLAQAAELLDGGERRLDDPRALHRLRIRCRKLRYACELLERDASVQAASPAPLLETLAELQDRLGALHDRDVQIEQLGRRRDAGSGRKSDACWTAARLERIEQASTAALRRQATRLLRQTLAEVARLRFRLTQDR